MTARNEIEAARQRAKRSDPVYRAKENVAQQKRMRKRRKQAAYQALERAHRWWKPR